MIKCISTVMFDFGGVLIDLNQDSCVKAFERMGVHKITNYINKYSQEGLFAKIETGELSIDEFHNNIRKLFNIDVKDKQIDEAWNAFLVSIPESKLDLLRRLKRKYRVIMLSNTNAIHFEQKAMQEFAKQGLSIDDYFDQYYLSYKIKIAKPDERIFRSVLNKEHTTSDKILYIDDGEENIRVAKALGFKTHLANEHEDFSPLFDI